MDRSSLNRFAWLSIGAAVVTMALKGLAYVLTGSVGLLSDAMESLVNLAGAIMALAMLTLAARPEDESHPHGHGKAEYFSSGVEGALILVAAVGIAFSALQRLLHPRALVDIGPGLLVSAAASVLNLGVALVILKAARRHESITLEANAHHLLTDVWTSVGVIAGVGAVAVTHWLWLDPVVALVVAANIVRTGGSIVRRSVLGLMDVAVSEEEQARLREVLAPYLTRGVQYHALRTRQAGARRFVTLHVLVPGDLTVREGHRLLEALEADIRAAIPNVTVLTHLEALDDPASWDDVELDRPADAGAGAPVPPTAPEGAPAAGALREPAPVSIRGPETAHRKWGDDCDAWILAAGPDISVLEEEMPGGTEEREHHHMRSRQFFYVLSGAVEMRLDGRKWKLEQGEGLEIAPRLRHRVANREDASARFLVISSPAVDGDRVE